MTRTVERGSSTKTRLLGRGKRQDAGVAKAARLAPSSALEATDLVAVCMAGSVVGSATRASSLSLESHVSIVPTEKEEPLTGETIPWN